MAHTQARVALTGRAADDPMGEDPDSDYTHHQTPEGWEGEAKKQNQGGTENLEWRKLRHGCTDLGLSYNCQSFR